MSGFEPLAVRLQEARKSLGTHVSAIAVSPSTCTNRLSGLQISSEQPCRGVPDNAVLSVGFLWDRRRGTRSCGDFVGTRSSRISSVLANLWLLDSTVAGRPSVSGPVTQRRIMTVTRCRLTLDRMIAHR